MPFLEDRDLVDAPTIPEYYKGKTIFISGGSGFMGKVLVEKLLYSCSGLDRIYLLLRSKRGVNAEERIAAIYSTHCFDRLRKEKPGLFESKVFFIAGDVSDNGLGMSEEDRTLLVNRTNIIFHAAASVRFNDQLKEAVQINLRGTLEMLNLAKEVRNLESFIHVSTAYSNSNRDLVEEVMYPPLVDWRDTLRICDEIDDRTLEALTPKYLGEMPNTYGLTKQLAEHIVYELKGKLPIVIVRPSIVTSSVSEPMPGWIETFNGPTGIFIARGKGLLRTAYSKPDLAPDVIPVDVSIKSIITASWVRGIKKLESTDDVKIYNSCGADIHLFLNSTDLNIIGKKMIEDRPMKNTIWVYGTRMTSSLFIFKLQVLLYHVLPAIFIDMVLWLLGKKPMVIKLQRRIYTGTLVLSYYIGHQWTFTNTNFIELRSKIKEADKKEFYYNLEEIDKYDYFKQSCEAGRKYLLNETEDDIVHSKAHYRRLQIIDKTIKYIFYGLLFYWLIRAFIKKLTVVIKE